jgi:hypothetical protein
MIAGQQKPLLILGLLLCVLPFMLGSSCMQQEKIGVVYVVHGGFEQYHLQHLWDASIHLFSYNPNHPVYKLFLWKSNNWGSMLKAGNAPKEIGKYSFEYERLGGEDPYHKLTDQQLADMEQVLNSSGTGKTFVVDYAAWMSPERVEHYPYPRYLYNPPADIQDGDNITYCGEQEDDGPWDNCDSERYNVDGPVERLLAQEVDKIIVIDLTTSGVRFFKTFDVITMMKRALTDNGSDIPVIWANDPTNLMEKSYPTVPAGWTQTLGEPEVDPSIPFDGNPNPVSSDPDFALLFVEGIETVMSEAVDDADTGILLLNHATREWNQMFDPKIDDTLVLNKNIESQLLDLHPDIDPENIVGAFMGIKEINPENELNERTREMRGENIGHAYLYEVVPHTLPSGKWGYLYWDALEYLKKQGVKHIVIAFPQITTDSVLNLVEQHNQIAKEIGKKTWLYWGKDDFDTYPGVGHPFTDYWGIWVETDCGGTPCCFEMGGCDDDRSYPPSRQTPLDEARGDLDPSLAYEVSDYGHLGYNQELGPPEPDNPVQEQYTGTWAYYRPPNDDSRVGQLLAKHVLNALLITTE